ncbi:MAG: EscU/YscU/HrcU family type III secretion system export apparatus switch protein [Pseudomonadota bacterium]
MSSGEKTEEPTDKKIQDAKKEGQLSQRKNTLEAILLSCGVLSMFSLAGTFSAAGIDVFHSATDGITMDFLQGAGNTLIAARELLFISMGLMCAFGFIVLFSNLLMTGFNVATAALKPRFEKLNPVHGLKGLFSKNTLYNFFRRLVYFTALSLILYAKIQSHLPRVVDASYCGLRCLADVFADMVVTTVVLVMLVMRAMAFADFKMQSRPFKKQMMMSLEDIKNVFKQQEGDPRVKGERKSLVKQDAKMPTAKDVTHVVYNNKALVALLYYPEQKVRPFVVMKASGGTVAKLQQRFRKMGVLTVNLPSVAIELYSMAPIGNYPPARFANAIGRLMNHIGE